MNKQLQEEYYDNFYDHTDDDAEYSKLEDLWLLGLPIKEIANDLKCTEKQLSYMVMDARSLGYDLPRRTNVIERRKTNKVFKY